MKRPFLFLTIPLILGICISYKLKIPEIAIILLVLVIIIVLTMSIAKGNKKHFNLSLFIAMILLGCFVTNYQMNKSNLVKFNNEDIKVEGIIKEVVSTSEESSKYICEVNKADYENKNYKINEKLLVYVWGSHKFHSGDNISIKGTIEIPDENTNPGLFDYRLYLQTNNIFTSMYINDYDLYIDSQGNLSFSQKTALKFKGKIEKLFDTVLKEHHSSFMKAMLLGDSKYLDEATQNTYRELGLAHVMAVSGLHIGIISLFLIYALTFMGVNRRIAIFITVLFIWFYGYLIGFPPSVLRASIMFSFLMLANIIYRRYDALNLIFLAAFILLIYNPLWVFSVGFQLSFLATMSLVLFTTRIEAILSRWNKDLGNKLSPLIAVQIGIIPIMAFHFNNISIISIITNLVIVPIISIALILGFIMVIISLISLKFVQVILLFSGVILGALLQIIDGFAYVFHSIPFINVSISSPHIIDIIVFYLLIFIVLKIVKIQFFADMLKYKVNRRILIFLYVMVIVCGLNVMIDKNRVVIEFIDVGQGDSSLLRIKGKNFLIDTGGTPFSDYDIGENVIVPYLKKEGIRKLDGVFITHFDADHCEGYPAIAKEIRIDNLFIGYKSIDNNLYNKICKVNKEEGINTTILNRGNRIKIDKYIEFLVLHPLSINDYQGEENNLSLTLILKIYDKKILFTGDIEESVEKELVKSSSNIDIDILKVPHHGSKTSSTEDFIDSFDPEVAIIQVGENNFGHPNEKVLSRYKSRNVQIKRNDLDGMVKAIINKKGYRIETYLPTRIDIITLLNKYHLQFLFSLILLSIYIYNLNDTKDGFINKIGGEDFEL
ncbi:DNA internalization-related competence protein ComEC/Rec2 [Sporosalibacterium faouarense]|uniref:DNA internalization-related competence protein ComEC/Rec2 n=1 Tax=Sporosalibacterium faouarense TaxID=516123 RepID=UPI00192BF8D7|nr:DNA internalization-related competence protein ComEC/Rec2 [Sporosalibacterium faouarense]